MSTSATLPGTVAAAPAGVKGFDTDTALTSSTAQAFAQAGFRFAVRYLSLGSSESSSDLTAHEAQNILNAGLALMAVQHVPYSDWHPDAQLGREYGGNAVHNANSVGLPAGVNVWLDLEGVSSGATASDVADYCAAWLETVSAGGYRCGIYTGFDSVLNSEQLAALPVSLFWNSGSDTGAGDTYPPDGYCMLQSINNSYVIDGVTYDLDMLQADNLGKTPFWLAPKGTTPTPPVPTPPAPTPAPPAPTPPPKPGRAKSLLKILAWIAGILIVYAGGFYTRPMLLQETAPASRPSAPSASTGHVSAARGATAASSLPAPEEPQAPPSARRFLLAGSFRDAEGADRRVRQLNSAGILDVTVGEATVNGDVYHAVYIGPFPDTEAANRTAALLKEKNIDSSLLPAGKAPK